MSNIPIDLLVNAPTSDQVYAKLVSALVTAGIPADSWRSGSVARSILGALAQVGAQGAAIISQAIAGMFLAFGSGDYLTAHALDVYNVTRIAASFATGTAASGSGVILTNSGGGVYTIGANSLIVSVGSGGITTGARYRVTQGFTLNSNSSLAVDVQAITAGSSQSVAPGQINTLETPLANVTVSNPLAIIGLDAETDAALVQRCLAKKGTWSQLGPRSAYKSAAISAQLSPGVPTTINRVTVSPFSSTNTVTVTCATPTGTPSPAELAAVVANIEAQARPDSTTCNVVGATTLATARTITIWSKAGTASLIQTNAQAALLAMIQAYPIGGISETQGGQGYLWADHIRSTVQAVDPTIFHVDLSDTTDLALGASQVAVDGSTIVVRVV